MTDKGGFIKNLTTTLVVVLTALLLTASALGPAFAQASAGERQTRPNIEERLTRQTDPPDRRAGVGLVRVDEGQKNLEKRIDDLRTEMNVRFSDLNERLDELRATLLTGFGVMFAGMFALIGFVIWDRRTALAPVAKQTRELAANQEKILTVLREYAKNDEKLMEFMKHAGLW